VSDRVLDDLLVILVVLREQVSSRLVLLLVVFLGWQQSRLLKSQIRRLFLPQRDLVLLLLRRRLL
jgi:hypothetical protein